MKAATGAAGTSGIAGEAAVQVGQDPHQEPERPGNPAGRIETRAWTRPALARQQVVGRHRAANRPERGPDDAKHAWQVAGDFRYCEDNGHDCARLLAELHRDSLYPMMGKDAWVAGADRREAPGPKPVRLGRCLWLRRQPPGSWQLWNGGVQRGVSEVL